MNKHFLKKRQNPRTKFLEKKNIKKFKKSFRTNGKYEVCNARNKGKDTALHKLFREYSTMLDRTLFWPRYELVQHTLQSFTPYGGKPLGSDHSGWVGLAKKSPWSCWWDGEDCHGPWGHTGGERFGFSQVMLTYLGNCHLLILKLFYSDQLMNQRLFSLITRSNLNNMCWEKVKIQISAWTLS